MPGGVSFNALKVIVPAVTFDWIAFVGSGPTERVTAILPGEYTGPSSVEGNAAVFGLKAFADAVARIEGSY